MDSMFQVLKKELDSLKDSVLKADAVARALEKKYEDENKKVKEVQNQYSAANNVRQDAYAHLQSLRKQLFEKVQLLFSDGLCLQKLKFQLFMADTHLLSFINKSC